MKIALVLILVAAAASAQDQVLAAFPQNACGPMGTAFQIKMGDSTYPRPQVEAGKALVYVIEDQRFKVVRDVTVRIGLDGAWAGATRGNSYLSLSVEPGEHHFCADMTMGRVPSQHLISLFGLTAEAGQVYYLRALTTGGPPSAMERNGLDDTVSVDLDLVNSDEGIFLVRSSPISVSHAKGHKDGKK